MIHKHILRSIGHSLALSISVDGAATFAICSLQQWWGIRHIYYSEHSVYDYAEGKISEPEKSYFESYVLGIHKFCGDFFGQHPNIELRPRYDEDYYYIQTKQGPIFTFLQGEVFALSNASKSAFYGLTPFLLRGMIKTWVTLNPFSAPAAFMIITLSSAAVGAYKYHSKGKPMIKGAIDNGLYAAANFLGFDSGLAGTVLTSVSIETFLCFYSNQFIAGSKDSLREGAFVGLVSGLTGHLLLDSAGLYSKFTNLDTVQNNLALGVSVLSVGSILYAGYNIAKNTHTNKYVGCSIGVALIAISISLCTTAAPATIVYAAVAFMEIDKIINKRSSANDNAVEVAAVAR